LAIRADRDHANYDLKLADSYTVETNGSITDSAVFYGVRSRLLWFTATLYSYLTDLVIEPNTRLIHVAIEAAEDVDRMIDLHRGYMKKLIDQALLGSKLGPIRETIITILDLSTQLVDARMKEITAQTERDGFATPTHDISLRLSRRRDPRTCKKIIERARYADSSDEDHSEDGTDPSTILAADVDLSYLDRMKMIRSQFDGLCKFVATGLRGVARAGGEPNWDILAEKLESGLGVEV
jgi:gamma-tubulin complex component 5